MLVRVAMLLHVWYMGRGQAHVGERVLGHPSPLSIKGKQLNRADSVGDRQLDPFMMKEETG